MQTAAGRAQYPVGVPHPDTMGPLPGRHGSLAVAGHPRNASIGSTKDYFRPSENRQSISNTVEGVRSGGTQHSSTALPRTGNHTAQSKSSTGTDRHGSISPTKAVIDRRGSVSPSKLSEHRQSVSPSKMARPSSGGTTTFRISGSGVTPIKSSSGRGGLFRSGGMGGDTGSEKGGRSRVKSATSPSTTPVMEYLGEEEGGLFGEGGGVPLSSGLSRRLKNSNNAAGDSLRPVTNERLKGKKGEKAEKASVAFEKRGSQKQLRHSKDGESIGPKGRDIGNSGRLKKQWSASNNLGQTTSSMKSKNEANASMPHRRSIEKDNSALGSKSSSKKAKQGGSSQGRITAILDVKAGESVPAPAPLTGKQLSPRSEADRDYEYEKAIDEDEEDAELLWFMDKQSPRANDTTTEVDGVIMAIRDKDKSPGLAAQASEQEALPNNVLGMTDPQKLQQQQQQKKMQHLKPTLEGKHQKDDSKKSRAKTSKSPDRATKGKGKNGGDKSGAKRWGSSKSKTTLGLLSASRRSPGPSGKSTVVDDNKPKKVILKTPDMSQLNLATHDISFKGLTQVPLFVFELENIGVLDLSGNNLRTIPAEISCLTQLRALNLSQNSLKCSTATDYTGIPRELSSLLNLEVLAVSECNLRHAPPAIFLCAHLRRLDLSRNKFSRLPPEIGSLTMLEYLNLAETSLKTLPPEIAYCEMLFDVNLYGNKVDSLPETMRELHHLTELRVNARAFCRGVDQYMDRHLKNGQVRSEHIPPVLFEIPELQQLNLERTRINNMPASCGTKLQGLSLAHNYFSALPQGVSDIPTLTSFDLSGNFLKSLPTDLSSYIRYIKTLKIGGNLLEKLPEDIGSLSLMEHLDVSENKLRELPAALGKCTCLRMLLAGRNRLESLPPAICALTNIHTLDLSRNRLTHLPVHLYRLKRIVSMHSYSHMEPVGLWLHGNPIRDPPQEAWKQEDISPLYDYLRNLEIKRTENLQRLKLILLGEEGCGKSSLLQALLTSREVETEEEKEKRKLAENSRPKSKKPGSRPASKHGKGAKVGDKEEEEEEDRCGRHPRCRRRYLTPLEKSQTMRRLPCDSMLLDQDNPQSTRVADIIHTRTLNEVRFCVIDGAGSAEFAPLRPYILTDTTACHLLAFDLGKYTTQRHEIAIGSWLRLLDTHAPGAVVTLVGILRPGRYDDDEDYIRNEGSTNPTVRQRKATAEDSEHYRETSATTTLTNNQTPGSNLLSDEPKVLFADDIGISENNRMENHEEEADGQEANTSVSSGKRLKSALRDRSSIASSVKSRYRVRVRDTSEEDQERDGAKTSASRKSDRAEYPSESYIDKVRRQVEENVRQQMEARQEQIMAEREEVLVNIEALEGMEESPSDTSTGNLDSLKERLTGLEQLRDCPLRIQPDMAIISCGEGLAGVQPLRKSLELLSIDRDLFPHNRRYIPSTWAPLGIALKRLPGYQLSLQKVKEIAKRGGVMGEEVGECLRYLRYEGSIWWWEGHPKLSEVIFHRPRALVDILACLYRSNLPQYLNYFNNKVFSSVGQLTELEFNDQCRRLLQYGELSRPMAQSFCFFLKVNWEEFLSVVDLMESFELAYVVPQVPLPTTNSYLDTFVVVPWSIAASTTDPQEAQTLQMYWDTMTSPTPVKGGDDPDDSIHPEDSTRPVDSPHEEARYYSFPQGVPPSSFQRLSAAVQKLCEKRVDWRRAVYLEMGEGEEQAKALIREDEENEELWDYKQEELSEEDDNGDADSIISDFSDVNAGKTSSDQLLISENRSDSRTNQRQTGRDDQLDHGDDEAQNSVEHGTKAETGGDYPTPPSSLSGDDDDDDGGEAAKEQGNRDDSVRCGDEESGVGKTKSMADEGSLTEPGPDERGNSTHDDNSLSNDDESNADGDNVDGENIDGENVDGENTSHIVIPPIAKSPAGRKDRFRDELAALPKPALVSIEVRCHDPARAQQCLQQLADVWETILSTAPGVYWKPGTKLQK